MCGYGGSAVQLYTLYTVWHVCLLGRCVWSWVKDSTTVYAVHCVTRVFVGEVCVVMGALHWHKKSINKIYS